MPSFPPLPRPAGQSGRISRRGVLAATLATTGAALATGARAQSPAPISQPRLLRAGISGYGGAAPGPLLKVGRGEEVYVRLVNDLPEPTAIHWHGVRLANAMDGAPPLTQAPIAAGQSFEYRFAAPDAGTFWYHPANGLAAAANQSGLYGALIVGETEPVDVDRDETLIFANPTTAASPDAGSVVVNGGSSFDIHARANDRLRLRLINACRRSLLGLRFQSLRTFVMATDGEPAEPFAAREGRILLGPGNRIDVFVDCTLDPGGTAPILLDGTSDAAPIARIVCAPAPGSRKVPRDDPRPLPPNPLPERMNFAGAFRFETRLGTSAGSTAAPVFAVKRGRTVMLGLSNPTSENQSIHLHGHHFRLLDALDDGWKPFWLDTLPIASHGSARIAFVADNAGKWLIEGLAPEASPQAWFEVSS